MMLFGYRVPMMASLLVWARALGARRPARPRLPAAAASATCSPPRSSSCRRRPGRARRSRRCAASSSAWPSPSSSACRSASSWAASKVADDLLGMWVNIFSSAPLSALVPVLMILFGFGEPTIVAAVFLFAVWIIVLDTRAGVRHISPSLIEMARSYGASQPALYGKIILWAALPEILAGIRLGLIRGVKGVVIGQLLVSIVGYGALFETFSRNFRMAAFLGAHHHPLRLRHGPRRGDRAGRAQGRILRRSEMMNVHTAAPSTSSTRRRRGAAGGRLRRSVPGSPHLLRRAQLRRPRRSRWATTRTRSRLSSSRRTPTTSCSAASFPIRRPRRTCTTRSSWSWR